MQSTDCRTRETLKKYLAGWVEHEESSAIEAHVLACAACEQTISGLESDPDTLVTFLRTQTERDDRANGKPENPETDGAETKDAVLQYALAKAKTLGTQIDDNRAATFPEAPPKTVGPYELIQSLGHGSMGAVYLARHQQLGKQVAIKLLSARPFRNDQFTARFQREIRAAGSLNHPSIINATDAGQSETVHYLVMEYIEGMDLSRLARLTGPLSIADTCNMMHSVALGLSHAHAAGIVHRDIKPSNLMLSRNGQVKILDFGLAQISLWDEASAELTTVGQLMGTIDYMAPEQAERADSVDYRADLYSLGATLFKLLCGRAPLAATPDLSPLTKLRLLATSQPPSLSTLRPDAPPALVQLVSTLLARDPANRPASAAHAAEMLAEFSQGSDLPKLMRSADDIASTEVKSIDNRLSANTAFQSANATSPQTNASGWGSFIGGSFIRSAVTAAAFAFLAAGGIFITIETQKGQLVIESVDANAEVKISKAGKVYDTVQLVPGANTTRLYAGSYEVTIDAGSDRFQLDHDKIEIKRGETIVARVVSNVNAQQTTTAQTTTALTTPAQTTTEQPAAATGVDPSEPVYDGKTLSMWLIEFARDRSPTAITKSLAAISALANSSNQDRIASAVLAALPAIPEDHYFLTFESLWAILGDAEKYRGYLLRSLDAKNAAWTTRALRTGTTVHYQKSRAQRVNYTDRDSVVELKPITQWIVNELLSPDAATRNETQRPSADREELIKTASFELVSAINYHVFEPELEEKYLDMMRSHQELGPSFWLVLGPVEKLKDDSQWNPKLLDLIESKAIEYFIDPKTSEQYVAQAAMLLVAFSTDFDRTGMAPPKHSPELVSALERRLREFAENPARLTVLVQVDNGFGSSALPKFGNSPLFAEYQVQISIGSPAKCLLVCELFDLVASAKAIDGCYGYVRAIRNAMSAKANEGGVKLARNPFSKQPDLNRSQMGMPGIVNVISINWPTVDVKYNSINWPTVDVKYNSIQIISQQEFLAIAICNQAEGLMPEADAAKLQVAQKEEIQTKWIAAKVRAYDTDNDGFLIYDEFPLKDFSAVDSNQDKKLSPDELHKYSIENDYPRSIPASRRP